MNNNNNQNLNHVIDDIAIKSGTVSLSASAICGKDVIWNHTYGYYDKEKKLKAESETIYRIASASKHISCIIAMTLVDKGFVNLDMDIGIYLGYDVRNPYFPNIPITLRQLMTHTSTIIETGSYNKILSGQMPPYLLSEILTKDAPGYLADNFQDAEPGKYHSYSSFGTGILSAIVEKITGMKFAEYANEKLFSPLGLNAGFSEDFLLESSNIAKPYDINQTDDEATRLWMQKSLANKKALCDLPIGEAYRIAQGNVHINAYDLAYLMQIFFFSGAVDGIQILTPNSVSNMIRPQYSENKITSGLGLYHLDYIRPGLIGHYGRAYGAFTMIAFNPVLKKGAVVLMNGTNPQVDKYGYNKVCTQALLSIYDCIDV
jgi:CubicO group peptidase (beta-lactamase class C family)